MLANDRDTAEFLLKLQLRTSKCSPPTCGLKNLLLDHSLDFSLGLDDDHARQWLRCWLSNSAPLVRRAADCSDPSENKQTNNQTTTNEQTQHYARPRKRANNQAPQASKQARTRTSKQAIKQAIKLSKQDSSKQTMQASKQANKQART